MEHTDDVNSIDSDGVRTPDAASFYGVRNNRNTNKEADANDSRSLPESWDGIFETLDALFNEESGHEVEHWNIDKRMSQKSSRESQTTNASSAGINNDISAGATTPELFGFEHELELNLDETQQELNFYNLDFEDVPVVGGGGAGGQDTDGQMVPLYPMGPLEYKECVVCCLTTDLNLRACCSGAVCDACMLSYITLQVRFLRPW